MDQQYIYFMDFIEQHFKNPEELLKILRRKCSGDTWKDIFNFLVFTKNINFVFDKYLLWDRDYQKLNFNSLFELSAVHFIWQDLIKTKKNSSNDHDLFRFKKNGIRKIKINFEEE